MFDHRRHRVDQRLDFRVRVLFSERETHARPRPFFRQSDRGEHVRRVQQTLIDTGFMNPSGATGIYDRQTRLAVERFQRETGLSIDGNVGRETLSAMAATAPPPGQQLERRAEYDRMYRDGRLDMTIAVGYDEGGSVPDTERDILSGLRAQGYRALSQVPEPRGRSAPSQRRYAAHPGGHRARDRRRSLDTNSRGVVDQQGASGAAVAANSSA